MSAEVAAVQVTGVPSATSTPVVIEKYQDFAEVMDLEAEWDAFVEAAGADIYATFAWCRTWWRFYGEGRRLALFLFRQDGRLVAIFPLFFETVSLVGCPVRFVRLVGCDHSVTTCRPVIETGMERTVVGLLAKELTAGSVPWDVLQFGPLPGYAGRVDELAGAVREHFKHCNVEVPAEGEHTVFHLPDAFEAYLSALSVRERAHVRQDERRLRRGHDVAIVFHDAPGLVGAAFLRFARLHEALWRADGRLGHFCDWPRAAEFHRALVTALASRGRVYISELLVDNTVVASHYHFQFGRAVHWFLTARAAGGKWSKLSVGRVLFLENVRHAIDRGAVLLDGLGGHYEYKVRLGGHLTQKRTIVAVRTSRSATVRAWVLRRMARVLDKVYYRIWFARVGPTLRLLRGPLWRSWIRSRV